MRTVRDVKLRASAANCDCMSRTMPSASPFDSGTADPFWLGGAGAGLGAVAIGRIGFGAVLMVDRERCDFRGKARVAHHSRRLERKSSAHDRRRIRQGKASTRARPESQPEDGFPGGPRAEPRRGRCTLPHVRPVPLADDTGSEDPSRSDSRHRAFLLTSPRLMTVTIL